MTTVLRAHITMRDDAAAHQIRITTCRKPDGTGSDQIAVSCTCRAIPGTHNAGGPSYEPLAARDRWDDPADYWAIWRQHHAEAEATA